MAKVVEVPTAEWTMRPHPIGDVDVVRRTVAGWKVPAPFLDFWFRATSEHLSPDDELRVVVDYDEATGLLSYDAFVRDIRVYGADDFVGNL